MIVYLMSDLFRSSLFIFIQFIFLLYFLTSSPFIVFFLFYLLLFTFSYTIRGRFLLAPWSENLPGRTHVIEICAGNGFMKYSNESSVHGLKVDARKIACLLRIMFGKWFALASL